MINNDDPAVENRQEAERTSIRLSKENTDALKRVNKKILYYLDRLPLKEQREVVTLNHLMEEQDRLVRVRITGHVPLRVEIFNDNERYRANHLRSRFKYAQRRGNIRKPADKREPEVVFFGNERSMTLHLPECR